MSALPIAWRVALVAAAVTAGAVVAVSGPSAWDAARRGEERRADLVDLVASEPAADLEVLAGDGFAIRFDDVGTAVRVSPERHAELAIEVGTACLERTGASGARAAPDHPGWVAACAQDARGWLVVGRSAGGGTVADRLWVLVAVLATLAAGLVATAVRRGLAPLDQLTSAAGRLADGQPLDLDAPEEPELQPVAAALRALEAAQKEREDAVAARLELSQHLAGIVAHEVRNPLQSLGMLSDLACHEEDPGRRREHLQHINRELALVEEVVRRLVDGGDELHLVRRPTDLHRLARRCLDLVGVEAPGRTRLDGAEVTLDVDGALVRRALENLVRNALREGARVRVTIGPRGLVVEDDGPGVAPSDRERIFDAGVSGSGGTGLGLALARRVADAHGGSLRCEASELGGARFVLQLVPGDA